MYRVMTLTPLSLAVALMAAGFLSTDSANAVVVVEEKAGVNIIRNVKTFSALTKQVRDKRSIGSSILLKPERTLSAEELVRCNRRARVISVQDNATIVRSDAGYCQ